jgi:pimeloyl-ACP methyl ester carboxylesterase
VTKRRFTLHYFRNLLVATLAALAFAFYVVLPLIEGYQTLRPTRYPIGDVTPAALGLAYEDVTLTTRDGLKLYGWYIPSQNRAAVIDVHAYNGNRTGVIYHAQLLAEQGYGVLLFDLRAHGESQGKIFAMGWDADQDILAALEYLQDRPEVDPQRIGVLGLSIGAEIALQTAAGDQRLKAVVLEGCGYRTYQDWLLIRDPYWPILLPGIWASFRAAELLSGVAQPLPSDLLIDKISPTPLLLISAGRENLINQAYFEAAKPPKYQWVRPEEGHIDALFVRPEEYRQKVLPFLEQALLP